MTTTRWMVAGLLAVGLSTALPAASQADQYYRSRRTSTYDIGYKIGQQQGQDEGRNDARRGHRFELYREHDYREGILGYRPQYGPKEIYAEGFREGFAQGYRENYARFRRDNHRRNDNYDRRDDRHDWRDDDDY